MEIQQTFDYHSNGANYRIQIIIEYYKWIFLSTTESLLRFGWACFKSYIWYVQYTNVHIYNNTLAILCEVVNNSIASPICYQTIHSNWGSLLLCGSSQFMEDVWQVSITFKMIQNNWHTQTWFLEFAAPFIKKHGKILILNSKLIGFCKKLIFWMKNENNLLKYNNG